MTDPDEQAPGSRTDGLRGLLGGVGRTVADRVGAQLDAARVVGESPSTRDTAASVLRGLAGDAGHAVSGLVTGVGDDVAGAVRREIGSVRDELRTSARAGARGAGLLGAAAATGNVAVLFTGIALWRGLGNRIGYARSAAVVAAVSSAAAAALAARGMSELADAQRSRRRRP